MTANQHFRLHFAYGSWVGYMALVCLLSLWPMPPGPETGCLDKAVHLILYLVMGLAVPWPLDLARAWRTLALLVAVGVALEVLQEVMRLGRHGDVLDALANTVGAALGLGLRLWLVGRAGSRPGREEG